MTKTFIPQEVNGAYCMPCYRDREYLSATGRVQDIDTGAPYRCTNKGCGKIGTVWAVLKTEFLRNPLPLDVHDQVEESGILSEQNVITDDQDDTSAVPS